MCFIVPLWVLALSAFLLLLMGYLLGRYAAVRTLRPVIRRMRRKAAREASCRPAAMARKEAKGHAKGYAEGRADALERILSLEDENRSLRQQVRMEALLDQRIKGRQVAAAKGAS